MCVCCNNIKRWVMSLYTDYLDVLKKWLWLEDEEGIDIIIATAIAAMMPGDPLWLFVVDPPGSFSKRS